MTAPRTGFRYLDEPVERGGVVAMAHRGGALHPECVGLENTLAAFSVAAELGYRYLETDVHATRDGVLLAFHDEHLDRVTDRVGRLVELVAAEVGLARVAGREPIPHFADLLEAFPEARFNVDLKAPAAVDPMVDLLRRTGAYDRVCIGSFTETTLRRFRRQLGDRVATTVGVLGVAVDRVLPWGPLRRAIRDDGAVLQVPVAHLGVTIVDRRFVERAHAAGRHVHVWTVDERAEMERLIDLGVDGLITDRTDVLRDVLVERGLWEETS